MEKPFGKIINFDVVIKHSFKSVIGLTNPWTDSSSHYDTLDGA